MVDTAVADAPIFADLIPTKQGRSRKALKPKNPSSNDSNILAREISQSSPTIIPSLPEESAGKENHESLSQPHSLKKKKKTTKGAPKTKSQQPNQSFEKEFEEMQAKLQQLTLAKEQTEELLKEKEETLKLKEEELKMRGREQEKLQLELKKLQKLKEFKPTMTFPIVHSLRERDQERKEKKKKGCPEKKRPSPHYVLWVKDQWNEVKKGDNENDV